MTDTDDKTQPEYELVYTVRGGKVDDCVLSQRSWYRLPPGLALRAIQAGLAVRPDEVPEDDSPTKQAIARAEANRRRRLAALEVEASKQVDLAAQALENVARRRRLAEVEASKLPDMAAVAEENAIRRHNALFVEELREPRGLGEEQAESLADILTGGVRHATD